MRQSAIIILLFLTTSLFAQTELPKGQIEVVKDFEVRLTETKKIRIIPQPIAIDSSARHYEYLLLAPSPSIEYEVPELKPLAIEAELKPQYYPLLAKAGYGSPNSVLALFSYDHVQNEKFDWGVDFDHLSANNKKIPLQKFSDSGASVNGSYLLNESVQVEGYIGGRSESHYFYGAEEIPANPDALKRSFKRYDVNFGASNSIAENASVHYKGFLQYLFDKDDLGSRERTIKLGGEVQTSLGEEENPIGIKVLADLSKMKEVDKRSVNNVLVEPFFQYHTGDFKIHVGGIALLKKEANEFLPALELSYNLFPLVSLRAGWQGDVVKNNFHSLSTYNPYITSRLDSIGNMISRRVYAGIKGVSGKFKYEVTSGFAKFEDMVLFLQDPDNPEEFNPIYEDGTFIAIEGSIFFDLINNLSFGGDAYTRFYDLETEEKPWHRPSVGIDARLTYAGSEDDYHVSLAMIVENGLPYITVGGTESRLDPLLDIRIHGDYFFSSALGAFLELNNLLGNNRERWVNYPSYGFNTKAGLMLRM